MRPKNNFLNVADVLKRPKPPWLLPGILPRGTLGVLFAPPKSAKSFLALYYSLVLCSEGNNVVYIAGEGVGGLGERLRAWSKQYEEALDDGEHALYFPEIPLNVFSKPAIERFIHDVRESGAFQKDVEGEPSRDIVDLIVVDTLSRCMIGADENDASDVSIAIDHLDHIRRELGSTVLVLHHTTKSSTQVERGSTALRGAADVMLRLSRKNDRYTLAVQAARDFESGGEFYYELAEVGEGAVIIPSQEAPDSAPVQAAVFVAVKEGLSSPKDIREALKLSQQAVADALAKLVEKGAIVKEGRGTYKAGGA